VSCPAPQCKSFPQTRIIPTPLAALLQRPSTQQCDKWLQELQAVSNLARRVNSPYKGRNSPLRGASGRSSPVSPRTRATTEHGPRAEPVGGAASINPRVARLSQRFVAGLCLSSSIALTVNIHCPSPDLSTLNWTSSITKDAKMHWGL